MQDMKRLIEKLGYEDLMRMKKELEEGELKKFIEQGGIRDERKP